MRRLFVFLFALGLSLSFPDPTVSPQEKSGTYQEAVSFCQSVAASKVKKRYRSYWRGCLERMEAAAASYRGNSLGAAARLMLGELYQELYAVTRGRRDLEGAIASYNQLLQEYPDSPQVPEGLYRLGRFLKDVKGREQEGLDKLMVLVERYPDSPRAADARKLLARSGRRFSEAVREAGSLAVTVTAIRYFNNPGYGRVVLNTDRQTSYSYTFLPPYHGGSPSPRLYVDLARAVLSKTVKDGPVQKGGPVKGIRAAQHDPNTVRVVLDLEAVESYKVFPLLNPFRVVIDVGRKGLGGEVPLGSGREPGGPRIVLDPGHGGDDPGAMGPDGMMEKEVVLTISQKIKELAARELGAEVVLTRDRDVFIPLEERTALANGVGADLFISVHANASPRQGSRGIETYYLSLTTDKESMELAAVENASAVKEMSEIGFILNDLLRNSNITESSRLAASIQERLVEQASLKRGRVRNLGVKQAPFFVLMGAQMPGVLVETAFISNPREGKLLKDEGYLEVLARGVVSGIKDYLGSSRPRFVRQ